MSTEIDREATEIAESPVRFSELIEIIDREGFHILLPCSVDAINGYFTSDTAPISYKRLSERTYDAVSFMIKVGRDFSDFTETQKIEAIGQIASALRPLDRMWISMKGFRQDDLYNLLLVSLRAQHNSVD